MKRRDVLAGHTERIGRRETGRTPRGKFPTYATTVACECGWHSPELPMAPSCGGRVEGTRLHQLHVEDLLSRDPELTLLAARTAWRDWRPGDGVTYRIKICRIEGGLADCDKVLLVNIGGRTWAFQFPVTEVRRQKLEHDCEYLISLRRGVPPRAWDAVWPLLKALGVR